MKYSFIAVKHIVSINREIDDEPPGIKKVNGMADTVAEMSKDELKEMLAMTVEQKLLELLGDPDEGLEIRKSVQDRLIRQQEAVAAGERGESLEDVKHRLGPD